MYIIKLIKTIKRAEVLLNFMDDMNFKLCIGIKLSDKFTNEFLHWTQGQLFINETYIFLIAKADFEALKNGDLNSKNWNCNYKLRDIKTTLVSHADIKQIYIAEDDYLRRQFLGVDTRLGSRYFIFFEKEMTEDKYTPFVANYYQLKNGDNTRLQSIENLINS